LEAALARLQELHVSDPQKRVFGVDIDEVAARRSARRLLRAGVPRSNIKTCDFFAIGVPESEEERFDSVIGNPPYVRGSAIDRKTATRAFRAVEIAGVPLSRQANLWALFVVQATLYVRRGGRLAFLLPLSAVEARYSATVRSWLRESFGHVSLVITDARLFADAAEQTVLLLASERGETADEIAFSTARTLDEAVAAQASPRNRRTLARPYRAPLLERADALVTEILKHAHVSALGDVAQIRIGVVTGANSFFTRAVGDFPAQDTVPVVATSKWLRSAIWLKADQREIEESGARARLLHPRSSEMSRAIATAVLEAEAGGIRERCHCRKRRLWWFLEDVGSPDAFLPYMGVQPGLLVLNSAGATCTNSVHRIFWRQGCPNGAGLIASTWTSLFAVASELHGRHYGGGVLKTEPGAAQLLPLVTGIGAIELERIDAIARERGRLEAVKYGDAVVLEARLGLGPTQIALLRDAALFLRAQRTPPTRRRT
jgi:hypothetical protein